MLRLIQLNLGYCKVTRGENIPTIYSTRALCVVNHVHKQKTPDLIIGANSVAKTSIQLMFSAKQNPNPGVQ